MQSRKSRGRAQEAFLLQECWVIRWIIEVGRAPPPAFLRCSHSDQRAGLGDGAFDC